MNYPQENSIHQEAKACAEAFQSVQKRTRIAFFLSLAVSCIVILMVLNLWEAHEFRRTLNTVALKNTSALNIKDKQVSTAEQQAGQQNEQIAEQKTYLKEYSQHVADSSFYQITALGIQISCEDVGIIGPLALFIFSLYSAMAFEAYYGHVQCAKKQMFGDNLLIRVLLETELPSENQEQTLGKFGINIKTFARWFLFLPLGACMAVIAYSQFAYWSDHSTDILGPFIDQNPYMTIVLDFVGILFTLLVFYCNFRTFHFLGKILKERPPSNTGDDVKSAGASAGTLK